MFQVPAMRLLFVLMSMTCVAAQAAEPPSAARGESVFQTICARCHGPRGDGDSQLAKLMTVKPANLRVSRLDAVAMERIVRDGGAAVGRSGAMPAWGQELTPQQLQDVLAYVRSRVVGK